MKNANYVKFSEERVMCMEKHVLVKNIYKWPQNMFTNSLKVCLQQRASSEKTVHGMEGYWLSG